MVSKKVTIVNEQGMHMRPASLFTQKASEFNCSVRINYNGTTYNAKSIMSLMTACIKYGSDFEIICDGPDEKEALKVTSEFVESGLGD